MHIAARNNCMQVAKYLVEKMKIDPNEPKDSAKNITPLSIALTKGHMDLAKYFLTKGCPLTPQMFYLSSSHCTKEVISFMLD